MRHIATSINNVFTPRYSEVSIEMAPVKKFITAGEIYAPGYVFFKNISGGGCRPDDPTYKKHCSQLVCMG